ncbi:ferrochelatase [Xanthomonadaceae bacterium JHOS43]|jgi:ferrochelatase|nr:ferrochelatase [Xanthomonadaceae bacterium JHOS43]MCX7564111.1 ferrochelatase [Xanthomonadaceae bacterium XH05]
MSDHPSRACPADSARIGVLLVNLGTPSAPKASALRRYLAEFLADPRVVELPRVLWYPILYGIILPFRAPRSAALYRNVWTERGSPLRFISEDLAAALGERLQGRADVVLAMRYGEPSVATQLRAMRERDIRKLLILPIYPQYSATTTASVLDAVMAELGRWRYWPELRVINQYHEETSWIDAVASKIDEHRKQRTESAHLLFSFHGIPQRCVDRGDPYATQCEASAHAIARRLGLGDGEWSLSYQSRLGKAQWLMPYTDQTVRELARRGVTHLDVVCPGFAADCLETLEEIAMENAGFFKEAGGRELNYIPALNADPAHVDVMGELIERHLAGW